METCTVARGNAARATLALASYHLSPECQKISQRVRERINKMLREFEGLGETTLRLTSGQLRRQSNGTIKYGGDHGPAEEASFNPMLPLNDPR